MPLPEMCSRVHGALALLLLCIVPFGSASYGNSSCRFVPGDAAWPGQGDWDKLNTSVNGQLIASSPIARVCHGSTYSESECTTLKEQWGYSSIKTSRPAEILAPWFQNQTCVPFTPQETPCTLGDFASYSINVTAVSDIQAGLEFAQQHNIRLVIRGTGHDLLGKSTGHGALSLWTHSLDAIEVIPSYTSTYYQGPALKVGAGVQSVDAIRVAYESGYRVVTGSCPNVAVAGGYTQGGGHSLLSSLYGMSADNVLEWEVVTTNGTVLTVTPEQHSDLYWALSGGGGGTYGVVVSMTVRVFDDGPVGSASLYLSAAAAGSDAAYWEAVRIFHNHLPALVDQPGIVVVYSVSEDTLLLYTLVAPNRTTDDVAALMSPLLTDLTEATNLTSETMFVTTTSGSTYYDYYMSNLEPLLATSPMSPVVGGRFISRENVQNGSSVVTDAFQAVTSGGNFSFTCVALNVDESNIVAPIAQNAVHQAWRASLATCMVGSVWNWGDSWDLVLEQQGELVSTVMPILEAATPDSAAYLNEANFAQTNWQDVFYGSNYGKLQKIKQVYDSANMLYAVTGVGSDAWEEDGDKRLCRKHT